MKIADIRAKTDAELKDQMSGLAKEGFNLRFQKAAGQLQNTARTRQIRQSIAQIQTVLGERTRGVKNEGKQVAAKNKKTKAE